MNNENRFTFKHESNYPEQASTIVVMTTDEEELPKLLDDITAFLRGAGFRFNGNLEIVDEEEVEEEEYEEETHGV